MLSGPRRETPLCYVSSEHCYPKPGASWEKSEEREKQTAAVKEEQNTKQEVKTGSRSGLHINTYLSKNEEGK